MESIPASLNLDKKSSCVFISGGGNDILDSPTRVNIATLFEKLMSFIKTFKSKFTQIEHIVVLNLYQPANPKYDTYRKMIDEWNHLLD
jgi:lysophospholipase L1-like esterase